MVVRALVLVLATLLAHTMLSLVRTIDVNTINNFFPGNSISGSYKDQYWYGGQSTGSGSGNTIGSHNAQSG